MTDSAINLKEKFGLFTDLWSPKVVAEMNNYQFKLAKVHGEFVWHEHPDTDEVFIVLKGQLKILFRDRTVHLNEGDLFVVPKGQEHKPVADEICHIMLVEPKGVVNTGDAESHLQAENDVWV